MATLVTHFVVGSSIALPFCRTRTMTEAIRPSAFVVSAGLLAVLPDLDTAYMSWVPYEDFLGHRGFWHSPFALVLLSCALAVFVAGLMRGVPARAALLLGATWAAAGVSHPILDALTDGGLGVMMFFPFSEERFFFPWQPIHVARIGVAGALDSFARVFPSELPFCAAALILGFAGFTFQARNSRSMKTIVPLLLLGGLCGMSGCETTPEAPQPTEAQKKARLEANEILTACAASDIAQVKALLDKKPALINAQDDVGATPLWRAVAALHPSDELVKLLLEKGANADGASKFDETPLQIAAGKGRKDIVLTLLEHGAKIGARDRYGRSALAYAAFRNQIEVADVLLAHGAEINVVEAAALGKTKKLEEFLRSDPNSLKAKDEQGLTPLHWAARNGHVEAVRLLLGHGASAFEGDRFGVTPCAGAREFKRAEIIQLMHCP